MLIPQCNSRHCYRPNLAPNLIALLANYVTVVEDRPIISAKYSLPVPVLHFSPKLTHPAIVELLDIRYNFINVKKKSIKDGYRRRSCTSGTAKIRRFVIFVMYCTITVTLT